MSASPAQAVQPSPPPGSSSPWFEPLHIRAERCKGCGLCVTACPREVLELDVESVNALGYHPVRLADPSSCTSCAICARVCPDAVFRVYAPRREVK